MIYQVSYETKNNGVIVLDTEDDLKSDLASLIKYAEIKDLNNLLWISCEAYNDYYDYENGQLNDLTTSTYNRDEICEYMHKGD